MNAMQHYRLAEKAIAAADLESAPEWASARLAEAQVHATLALTAVQAMREDEAPAEWWITFAQPETPENLS
jgi:hypothetical protein